MKPSRRMLRWMFSGGIVVVVAVASNGCTSRDTSQGQSSTGYYGSSAQGAPAVRCRVCSDSRQCTTCGGTGQFLGFSDTSRCNTCSGNGRCINCR